jgi:hypothetical protein
MSRSDVATGEGSGSSRPSGSPAAKKFSIVRTLVMFVGLGALSAAAVFGWIYSENIQEYFAKGQEPPLHPVKGIIYLDGEPMTDGYLQTKHEGGKKLLGGLGIIGKDGTFELKTNGVDGVYEGEHTVIVVWTNNGFPPLSYIPEKYSNFSEKPFSVQVDADTHKEPLKLELFGKKDLPNRPAGGMARPGVPTGDVTDAPQRNARPRNGAGRRPPEAQAEERPADENQEAEIPANAEKTSKNDK